VRRYIREGGTQHFYQPREVLTPTEEEKERGGYTRRKRVDSEGGAVRSEGGIEKMRISH